MLTNSKTVSITYLIKKLTSLRSIFKKVETVKYVIIYVEKLPRVVTLNQGGIFLRLILSYLFFFLLSISASAESIPYEKLVGVWTMSQDGVNHDLSKAQVSELCGMGLSIIHPNRNMGIHIRFKRDGKLLMSMDVQSKSPCTYADNQLYCEMEATSFGKSLGLSPGFFRFRKVWKGVYDVTALKPDGKTVDKVQTMYSCSMNISEAQAWLEANSGPGEFDEKVGETFNTLEQSTPQIKEGKKRKIELLKKEAKSGDARAQAGLGTLHLMAAVTKIGVEHDPERGLALLNQAAEKKVASAYVMLGSANMIPGFAFPKQDFETAYRWYEKAAETERADALNVTGMMKLFGLGTEQNGPQAVVKLTRAAEKGNPSAHFNLGIIRAFFPQDLKKRWKVSLKQDPVIGMMHLNLAAEQKHEPSQMVLQFLNQKQHPELADPARDRAKQWKKQHLWKTAFNMDYPDSIVQMDFKIEGGQIKFGDANINAKLKWSLGFGTREVKQNKTQNTGNKQLLLNKWRSFEDCKSSMFLLDDKENEFNLMHKDSIREIGYKISPDQKFINEKWLLFLYGETEVSENSIQGKYYDILENSYSYFNNSYRFETKNSKTALVLEIKEYYLIDASGNKIKQDVNGWSLFKPNDCNISNIRETKEFSAQLEHIKKMFNKK